MAGKERRRRQRREIKGRERMENGGMERKRRDAERSDEIGSRILQGVSIACYAHILY